MLAVVKVEQRLYVLVRFKYYVAAISSGAAVGFAYSVDAVAVEAFASVASVACLDADLRLVDEHREYTCLGFLSL
jgi:hypothetical protein